MNLKQFISIQALILVVLGFFDVESPEVFDMTTQDGINSAMADGFSLSEPPYRIFFKVANSLEATK